MRRPLDIRRLGFYFLSVLLTIEAGLVASDPSPIAAVGTVLVFTMWVDAVIGLVFACRAQERRTLT